MASLRLMASVLAVVPCLNGCSSLGTVPPPTPQGVRIESDLAPIDRMIMDATKRAADALESLRNIRSVEYDGPETAPVPNNVPRELMQPVTLSWHGPLDEAVETLAKKAGYKVTLIGHASGPVMVDVDRHKTPLIMLLREIGIQAGSRARLDVDPRHKRIEVTFNIFPRLKP